MKKTTIAKLTGVLLASSFLTQVALAQVTPDGGTATQVYQAPNNVPVVDIAKPNAQGLSHNTYTNYNVDSRGLVLNNGDFNQMARQSQLAGQVMANMNLTNGEASIILNEVTASNRSTLAGFTEVLGKAADVIVANPYGITCNGCGFINTPNATLTTGTPQITAGALTGFQVANGDILITGDGMDARQSDYLGLIARTVKLEKQVNAKDLDIVAGTNTWDYASRTATPTAPGGGAPTLAIDTAALGGMYANRIRLIATEAGIGVRMDGEAAAGTGDFELTSSGKIEINKAVSAARDVKIASTASGNAALRANDAKISATRNAELTAASGQLRLDGGTVTAGQNLTLSAASVLDAKTATAGADNNKRYAGGTLTVSPTGALSVDGTVYGAGTGIAGNADSITVGAQGATFYSAGTLALTAANAMGLGAAQLKSAGNLSLTSTNNKVTTTAGSIQSTAGAITITAGNGLDSNSSISADAGALNLRVSGTIANTSGALHGKTVTISDKNSGGTGTLTNQGTILADDSFDATVATLTNSNLLQSSGTMNLTIGSTLTNNATAKIVSAANMVLRGQSASAYAVNNANLIQSTGGKLDIKGFGAGTGVNISGTAATSSFLGDTVDFSATGTTLANSARIVSAGNLDLSTTTLTFSGSGSYITAANGGTGLGTITVTNAFTNPGFINSRDNLLFKGQGGTTNNGGIAATHALTIQTSGTNFTNNGALYAGTSLTYTGGSGTFFNNTNATVDSGQDASFTAGTFRNWSDINVGTNLTVEALHFFNEVSGGDQRHWSYEGTGFSPVLQAGDQDNRTAANENDHSAAVEPSNPALHNWVASEHHNDWIDDAGDVTYWWDATFYVYQYYAVNPTNHSTMVAGTSVTIRNFQDALNLGSYIIAPTVNISSNQGGAQFTNDAYGRTTQNWEAHWNHYDDCNAVNQNCSYHPYRSYDKFISNQSTDSYGGGIRANGGSLNASGFGLSNLGGVSGPSVDNPNAPAPTIGTGLPGSFGGITITVPTNPNGFFVTNQDPNAKYLIETNPKYGMGSSLGSEYMIQRLGIDPDDVQKRLGDGNYETKLVKDQLIAQTGNTVLVEGESEAGQMQRLMDNGVDQGKSLGLTYGKAPTATQLASLKEDMVWMVETEVNGQKVLAPIVYLSAATKSMIMTGAVIAGTNVNMDLDSVTNEGGTISGSDKLNITSKGDITNTSGLIKGGDVDLKSTEGSIVNETYARTSGTEQDSATVIGKRAGIEATGNLNVDAKKDITNKGADMSAGGNASLTAGDNITFDTVEDKKSKTTRSQSGGPVAFGGSSTETTESSTTQIKSGLKVGGDLKSKSGKDTTFAGTDAKVGGSADLDAGGNLSIISREDAHSKTTKTKTGNAIAGKETEHGVATTTNVGSNFDIGGDLKTRSTGDTTIQGSKLNVAGDGDMHAGGDMKILDGKNTTTTIDRESTSGVGQGGGVYGNVTETDKNYKSKSVGSELSFGGKATVSSDKTLTVQGSDVSTGGDLKLKGKDVKIVEGRDIETSEHTKETTTFLKVDGGESSSSSGADSDSGTDGASAKASANAEADASASGGVSLMEHETEQTNKFKSTAKGSNIKSGGNMSIEADNNATIRGSNVESAGDVDLKGKNVNIEAAQDVETTSTKKTKTQLGLYGSSDNKASAGAEAGAEADDGGASASGSASKSGGGAGYNAGNASASAKAKAEASASSDNTVDVMRTTTTETNTTDITHTGSTIKSGGKMKVEADNQLNVKGSDINAGGDLDLKAKDMSFTAAEDSHTTTTKTSTTKLGLYANTGADASAEAGGEAKAKGHSAEVGASAEANAEAGVGLYGTNTTSDKTEGSTTARTSSIKSGGNMNREATGKITDEGTQIEAGGDFSQTANEWESKAAKNTTFSSESSETNTAKLGLYGEAGASASASADATGGTEQESDAGASAGVKASYSRETSDSSSASSTAVTSSIKSGGKMTSTTKGKTSLEGTNLESGGDMELNAGSLDYKAAKNTSSSSSDTSKIDAELKVGVDATKAVTGTAAGGYEAGRSTDTSSEAVVGSMKSGGKLKVKTDGDARFEGTNIESADDASVKAGGNVTFDAAHNETTHTEGSENVKASISASKTKTGGGKDTKGMGLEAEGGFERKSSSSSDAVTGSIKSGGKLDVEAGKNATFEGTKLESKGDTTVDAKGDVNFNAAKSTSTSESYGASASISASKGGKDENGKKKGAEVGVEASGNYGKSDSTTSEAAGVKSGGNLKVKSGGNANFEGTNLEADGKAGIDAGGDVNFKAAEDSDSSINVEASVGLKKSKDEKGGNIEGSVEGGMSKTKKAGAIKAGEIEVNSGNNASFEGTSLDSTGDTTVKAKKDINFNAAESSHLDGSFSGGIGSDGASVGDAGIGGGVKKEGSKVNTGGNLKLESGGKTTLEGTKANVEGKAELKAGGGVDKKSTVSGGGQIGLTRGGADIDVQKTEINAKKGVSE